ncbi:MAG TPA: VOC family protein [Anaeromyxobacteraceae bacterium]|jgi:predicted 3-demethylubiquinone-9 3-methyltransferase (glyoxalase superfamily)|nr:VOC family protein [Anaeromyxobacteraceae bacterium]
MARITAKITPHLWFADKAVEAANLYVSLFPDSHLDGVTPIPVETPSGPPGSVQIVEFTLAGQPFVAINAGPLDPFNHAVSFVVSCADQAEVDHYWDALSAGGTAEQCGWLKDRYGLYWQIVPDALGELMKKADSAGGRRVMQAMLGMKKLDVAGLRRAYEGG